MVGAKATRAFGPLIAGILAACAVPAWAHDAADKPADAPDIARCNAFPVDPAAFKGREGPLKLPQEWTSFANSSLDWIAIETAFGSTFCVETAWFDEAENFEIFTDRFAGFEWNAYEGYGYTLIDRSGQGYAMDTGVRPIFSPSGERFAAIQVSEMGYGGLEGFGVWRTWPGGMQAIAVDSRVEVYPMLDWRIDRWEGEDCLHISAVAHDRIGSDWSRLDDAPRDSYVAGEANGWRIEKGDTCPVYRPAYGP